MARQDIEDVLSVLNRCMETAIRDEQEAKRKGWLHSTDYHRGVAKGYELSIKTINHFLS